MLPEESLPTIRTLIRKEGWHYIAPSCLGKTPRSKAKCSYILHFAMAPSAYYHLKSHKATVMPSERSALKAVFLIHINRGFFPQILRHDILMILEQVF